MFFLNNDYRLLISVFFYLYSSNLKEFIRPFALVNFMLQEVSC